MLVKGVIVSRVAVCWPEATLAEAAAILWKLRRGSLPVVEVTAAWSASLRIATSRSR